VPNTPTVKNRRLGDVVSIAGDYQLRALTEGPAVQRFWHHTKRLVIDRYLPPQRGEFVLDVGCGSGVVTSYLGLSGARVLGIDGNPAAVTFADYRFATRNVAFRHGYVDASFGDAEPADKVYCLELIEHLPADQGRSLLAGIHKALKPGGRALITTPNYRSGWPLIEWTMDTLKLAPKMREDQHVERYHRRKLARLVRAEGFRVVRTATTCLLAPWLAGLSWKLALAVHRLETGRWRVPGCILVCVLEKV
jgi:2-polyprenyl-3-methyl-5-hydroxy-6-metoxy-1,4-benzoquinol methylase